MTIYERPTKFLMADWAKGTLQPGQIFSKHDAINWFSKHYPKIKSITVGLHVEVMSINNPNRRHYPSIKPGSGHDVFYKLGSDQFRLKNAGIDGPPLYKWDIEKRILHPIVVDTGNPNQASKIRQFVFEHYIATATTKGISEVTIRAGDVHRDMNLANAMPAVCSAIGGDKFVELAGVTPLSRTGPPNGANVYFRFRLGMRPLSQRLSVSSAALLPTRSISNLDLAGSFVLVSCVKSKLSHPAPARELYTSAWFQKARDIVEASGARWFILSSRYGLVAPEAEIAPYDYTLNTLGEDERRAWAADVLDALLPLLANERRVVMIAGYRYREFLVEPLEQRGIEVEVPMAHHRRGEQLAWLSNFQ